MRPAAPAAGCIILLGLVQHAGALNRPTRPRRQHPRGGPKAFSRRAEHSWMRQVSDDVLAGGDGAPGGAERMSGLERARRFNGCRVAYRAPAEGIMPIVDPEARAVYFLEPKSASSTVRHSIGPDGVEWVPRQNYTLFTFVRDPAHRLVSAFLYKSLLCSGGQINHNSIKKEDPDSAESRQKVLGWFEEFIGRLEKNLDQHAYCWDTHVQGQRNRLPDPAEHPMDFIGDVSSIWADWQDLQAFQRERQHAALMDMPASRQFKATSREKLMLNVTVVPDRLRARICHLFRDEYCCFGFEIPKACNISCEAEGGRLPGSSPSAFP